MVVVEARGQSGVIWILQSKGSIVGCSIVDVYADAITLELTIGEESWFLTGIYVSLVYSMRLELWNHLSKLKDRILGPWLMMGDFNDIISPND